MLILKCQNCQNDFKCYPSRPKQYCSRKCYLIIHSDGTKKCKCGICHTIFYTPKNKINKNRGRFCSRRCADKGKQFLRQGFYKKCKCCHETFYTTKSRTKIGYGKFCNDHCRLKYYHDKILIRKCQVCDNKFKTIKYKIHRGNGLFCSLKCKQIGCRRRNKDYTKRKNIHCKNCNKIFDIVLSKLKNKHGNFCNRSCYNDWYSNEISTGNLSIPYGTSSKRGHYYSKINNINAYYDSSYELKRMEQLDALGCKWTKTHGIRIKYIDKTGKLRYYIPDFLVDEKFLEEIKPEKLKNSSYFRNDLKQIAAQKYCENNNLTYRIITETELGIKI